MGNQIGEFEELILLVIGALRENAYGVSILNKIKEDTQRSVNISAIHVVLKRLEEKGYVLSKFGGITEERGGRRKKFYSLTPIGQQVLDNQFELRNRLYLQNNPKLSNE